MDESKQYFLNSINELPYDVIQSGMLYIYPYIPNSIWENCNTIKQIYFKYNLHKITSYNIFTNSYIHACLHIMLLFDHSFVNNSLKRNNYMKISKLKNDTINNLLYLYCKQHIIHCIDTNFIHELKEYKYDLKFIMNTINDIINTCNITTKQRINIMLHCNNNTNLQNHEMQILDTIFKGYCLTIEQIGSHLTTQNACLIDESP